MSFLKKRKSIISHGLCSPITWWIELLSKMEMFCMGANMHWTDPSWREKAQTLGAVYEHFSASMLHIFTGHSIKSQHRDVSAVTAVQWIIIALQIMSACLVKIDLFSAPYRRLDQSSPPFLRWRCFTHTSQLQLLQALFTPKPPPTTPRQIRFGCYPRIAHSSSFRLRGNKN